METVAKTVANAVEWTAVTTDMNSAVWSGRYSVGKMADAKADVSAVKEAVLKAA